MKRLNKIFLIISLFTIICNSCTKLDETLYHNTKAEDFYTSPQEVMSALLRPYTHTNAWATSTDHRSWWKVSELSADQLSWPRKGVDGEDGGIWRRLHYHTWISDDDIAEIPWELMWTGIGYCNSAITNISERDANSMGITEEDKINYVAELKLLRAFYYMRTMDLYGNIPYETTVVTSPDPTNPPTLPRAQIFDSVEKEIKENINLIPNLSQQNLGRLSKAGAYAMLAELYLNAEVWSGKERWQDCINACDSIITGNVGGIVNNKITLDSTVTETYLPSNKASQEQIFAIVYNYQTANWSPGWPSNFYHFNQQYVYGGNVNGNNGIVVNPGVYNTYDNDDKRKKEWFFIGPMWYYNAVTKQDNADTIPILGIREYNGKQIVFVDAVKRFSELKDGHHTAQDSAALPSDMTTGEENSGVRINKWRLGTKEDPNYNSTSWIVYRLTWIYFAKAEALMRLNGNKATSAAVDLINACRKRDYDASVWASKEYTVGNFTMDSLLAERGREFITEGYRRQDLIRFNQFVSGSWWDHTPTNDKNKLLFPIPFKQLSLNPNLVQNPGY